MKSHIITVDQFSRVSQPLRKYFDEAFADPLGVDSRRFVWDYWHVPDQYTLHRTPAYHYFPENLYLKLHHELVHWGRKTLGCWDISPPWLSYYVDGCKQELHSDVPHGPWAYVFSLTPWNSRRFTGGETLLIKPEVLSYWKNFGQQENRELASFVDRIPSRMNRLTVFDPRFPHGVTEVRGVRDPREGRLVIHGWFMEPKTYIDGFVPKKKAEVQLNAAFDQVQELMQRSDLCTGTTSLQLRVAKSGLVSQARFATNTLLTLNGEKPRRLTQEILKIYRRLQFGSAKGPTDMTIPLIFQ